MLQLIIQYFYSSRLYFRKMAELCCRRKKEKAPIYQNPVQIIKPQEVKVDHEIKIEVKSKKESKKQYSKSIFIPEKVYWEKHPSMKIKGTPYTLSGFSVAARNTCFYIKELDMFLDCGVPHNLVPKYIFITHGHLDHTGQIAKSLIDTGKVKPIIVAPKPLIDMIKNQIRETFIMSKFNPNAKVAEKYDMIPAELGQDLSMNIKNMDMKIEIIKCFHGVVCDGYGFIEKRSKLKQEYRGMSQEEIANLKKEGKEITEIIEVPLFCFLGDTNYKVLEDKRLAKYPTIIIECSFLFPDEIQLAKKKNHMHWDQMKEYIKSHPNNTFVLTHFSARYTDFEINEFFEKQNVPNIEVWI
jgi:ribonuclease Z